MLEIAEEITPEEHRKYPPAPAIKTPAAMSAVERILLSVSRANKIGTKEAPNNSTETPNVDVANFAIAVAAVVKYGRTFCHTVLTMVAILLSQVPGKPFVRARVGSNLANESRKLRPL